MTHSNDSTEDTVTSTLSRSIAAVAACVTIAVIAHAQSPASADAMLKRVQKLEKRVEDLEKLLVAMAEDAGGGGQSAASPDEKPIARPSAGGAVTRVQAPFEVVAANGRPIIRVHEWDASKRRTGGVYAFSATGVAVAVMGPMTADGSSGRLMVLSPNGADGAFIAYQPERGGAYLAMTRNGGEKSVELNGGTGELNLYNSQGYAAIALKTGESGAGRLSIGDHAGNTVVEAGSTKAGLGIVRVGPRLGGTTGVSQGGMVLPNAIVGQK
jgi:hypothetical protein